MLYALDPNGKKIRPKKGVAAVCPGCNAQVNAVIPNLITPYWRHDSLPDCAYKKEPETPWHLAWKERWPEQNREYYQKKAEGKSHRADVRTDAGVVIEFQHSPISLEDMEAREGFWDNMIWVIDAEPFLNNLTITSDIETISSKTIYLGNITSLHTDENAKKLEEELKLKTLIRDKEVYKRKLFNHIESWKWIKNIYKVDGTFLLPGFNAIQIGEEQMAIDLGWFSEKTLKNIRNRLSVVEKFIQREENYISFLKERIAFYEKKEVVTFSGIDYLRITWDKVNINNIENVYFVKMGIQISVFYNPQLVGSLKNANLLASSGEGFPVVTKKYLTETHTKLINESTRKLCVQQQERQELELEFTDLFFTSIDFLRNRIVDEIIEIKRNVIAASICAIHYKHKMKLDQSQREKDIGIEVLCLKNQIEEIEYNADKIFKLEWRNRRRVWYKSTKELYIDTGRNTLLKVLPKGLCEPISLDKFLTKFGALMD